jgi:uncharacterized protein (DUF1800 family)
MNLLPHAASVNSARRRLRRASASLLLLLAVLAGSMLSVAPAQAQAQIQSGWWYNGAEGGRGYFIDQQGSTLYMAAFLYDAGGRATWLSSTGTIDGMTYQGQLTAYASGQTLTGAYVSPVQTPSPGDITILFSDASHATIIWPEGSIPIQRYQFAPGGLNSTGAAPVTGLYWNPAEGGRGYGFEVQNGILLFAGFMYDSSGNPIWYMSQGPMTNINLYQGQWQQYANGQSLTGTYKFPSVINPQVGPLTLQFTDVANATMTLPQGTQIPVTHFLFSQYSVTLPAGAEPAQITLAPNLLSFATQAINTGSAAKSMTLTNTGGTAASLLFSLGGNNPGDFSMFGNCVNGMNLAPGASCSISVIFTPLTSGARNAEISVQASGADAVQIAGLSGGATPNSTADTVRFLNQATFGPTASMLAYVQNTGINAFLEEQFAAPVTNYPAMAYYPPVQAANCTAVSGKPADPASICARDNYSLYQVQLHFFQNAMTAPDQLRQRVAWALSQIMVTSGTDITMGYAMTDYQQLLVANAFGNFRDIMTQVSLSPNMGDYLNMVNNDKGNASKTVQPNENYARELMQLFVLGLNQLNADGTPVLDNTGTPVPSYSQNDVMNVAAALTGWTYAPLPGVAQAKSHNPTNYSAPMVAVQANHDVTAKTLLGGVPDSANQTANAELGLVLDNIFNQSSVGPFIGRQLIQRLVTSNPTPAYVARVTQAFNNNGAGVRGDMKAVLRAILLDSEARGDLKIDPSYGHLREPVMLVTGVLRALNGASDGVYPNTQFAGMQQPLFFSPTVFNYYPPDYNIPGTALEGPEFAIQNATTAFARSNFINTLVFGNVIAPDPTVVGSIGTTLNLAGLQAISDPVQMIQQLNTLMFGGNMSAAVQNAILNAVLAVPASDPATRAKTAAYLAATSPQFQVIQ